MKLSKRDCENLIDALKEWHETCESKELEDDEVGFNDDRYQEFMARLLKEVLTERIICASIHCDDGKKYPCQPVNIKTGIVIMGRRHHNCITTIRELNPNYLKEPIKAKCMGFITTEDRHVNRTEAYRIAINSGQIRERKYNGKTEYLRSEDLY